MWGTSVNFSSSDRSLVFSMFVLGGGGGSVAIGHLVYILRIVLLSWVYVLCAGRVVNSGSG